MAIRTEPKSKPAIARALPVEKPKFDKTAYQREYMRKRRAGKAPTVAVKLPSELVAAWKATGEGWHARMIERLKLP